jgi:hypothetical protein
MNKKLAAEKIRQRLEARIANRLGCKPSELPYLKLGTLCHFMFLLEGDQETIGGFNTTVHALLTLLSYEIVWDIEVTKNERAAEKVEVIN